VRSAYCHLFDGTICECDWVENAELMTFIRHYPDTFTLVMESPQAQDRPLGPQLRDTIIMAGRIIELASQRKIPLVEADERDVAFWLTGNRSAGNPAVLQALKDQFGESRERICNACNGTGVQPGVRRATTKKCVGCRGKLLIKEPGPLAGLNEHIRSALAAAWWYHQRTSKQRERAAAEVA
jgi:hypothetical protein